METDKLTPEKSIELITQVIKEARNKFEKNGFIYMFWGALTSIASISQFVFLKNEYYDINWYPYLLMPLGLIFSLFYFSKKKNKRKTNQIAKIILLSWTALSLNMMIIGFFFFPLLKQNLIPVILVLLSLGIIISGFSLKSRLLLYSGIFVNILAFVAFKIDLIYQPLLMGIVSFVAIFIPGTILMLQQKKEHSNV